ncbi:hypothetical protein FRC00_005369 [Tulasnella sp. 408]|nr:hypothetical protein FRC00_005369 [Tulasnella sp. 408]
MLPVKRSRRKDLELPPPATASGANGVRNATTGPSSPNSNSNTNKKTTTFTDEAIGTGVRVHWSRFKKRLGAGSNISESLLEITESNGTSDKKDDQSLPPTANEKDSPNQDEEEVNEIVVDNKFLFDGGTRSITQPSDHGGTPEKSGTSATHGTHATDHDSVHSHRGVMAFVSFLSALRFRVRSSLSRFFFTEFFDAAAERQYKKETYYQMKGLSLAGSLVLLLNWVLICILIPRESIIFADKMFYWVIDVVYSYTSAYPVIALFALGQNRLMAAIMALLNAVLIASVIRLRKTWIRNFLNYALYTIFILWIHYTREVAERRLYTMRDRLKVQYRATQKAQVRESRAADSKKRFSSYIFHEVRVPLNTALLAVQNMQATGQFGADDIEYTALEGSLSMMSKVLNDVLDFNRMDSGRFESVAKPYAFHKVIKGMLVPLRMSAQARGQELFTELDSQIDVMARTALYRAKGMSEERIAQLLQDGDDEDSGLIVGDEHRLRQVVTNLASNASKFTPAGGRITVRTKLLLPGFGSVDDGTTAVGDSSPTPVKPRTNDDDDDEDDCPPIGHDDDYEDGDPRASHDIEAPPLTGERLAALESAGRPCQDQIIIRIEVEDTGVGIRRRDMVDNKLFSPYVQTDLGRFQGGKGTGLGLALSKHIVRLSGGRLGVKSKRGHGSMFWVELAVGVGQKVIANSDFQHLKDGIVAQSFAYNRDTTEAFLLPHGEGATPSTLQSTTSESLSPRDEALCAKQVQQTQQAMGRLMEHSGQIELVPRAMPHRLTDGSSSTHLRFGGSKIDLNAPSQHPAAPAVADGGPPSPTMSKRSSKGVLGASAGLAMTSAAQEPETVKATAVPTRPSMPDPALFDSASTAGPSKGEDPSSETLKPGPSSSATPKPPPPSPFSPPLNVLVVDDDALTRKLMARMLTRNGCVVETADNGKSAFDMAINAKNPFTWESAGAKADGEKVQTPYLQEMDPKYDVIFLDNQMPVMSGVDTVRRLRAMKRKDFVVGVTGNALKEDQEEYLEAGVDAVLTKPVAEGDLKKCLFSADERRKQAAAERQRRTSDAPSVSVPDPSPSGPS